MPWEDPVVVKARISYDALPTVATQPNPQPGDWVNVPIAESKGKPREGPGMVAVQVKPWTHSVTIWTSIGGLLWAVFTGVGDIIAPDLLAGNALEWDKLWPKLAVAAYASVILWRRKTENSVIGEKQK